ncbi:hypothetical protein PTKIN_Ptkin16aG0001100 [Pterospermum kingtungense]
MIDIRQSESKNQTSSEADLQQTSVLRTQNVQFFLRVPNPINPGNLCLQGPAVSSSTGVIWANGTMLDKVCISFERLSSFFSQDVGMQIDNHVKLDSQSTFHVIVSVVKDHQACSVELAGRNVHVITSIESWEEKLTEATRDGKILVANFSEPWSGPCRSIAPIYVELADKYPSFMFLAVDVDALAEFSTSWDINATPTFFFLKDGRQVDKFVGADKAELSKKMAAIANQASKLTSNHCP